MYDLFELLLMSPETATISRSKDFKSMCSIIKCMIVCIGNMLTSLGCRFKNSQIVIQVSLNMNIYRKCL